MSKDIGFKCKGFKLASIFISNDSGEDGYISKIISSALREYADMIDTGGAGFHSPEIFNDSNGTQLTCIVGSLICDENTLQDKGLVREIV